MIDVTDVDFRYFMRLLSRRTVLWTEMLVDHTILYTEEKYGTGTGTSSSDENGSMKKKKSTEPRCPYDESLGEYCLAHHDVEHPVICQLGGNT